jgi:hypothetical protein
MDVARAAAQDLSVLEPLPMIEKLSNGKRDLAFRDRKPGRSVAAGAPPR